MEALLLTETFQSLFKFCPCTGSFPHLYGAQEASPLRRAHILCFCIATSGIGFRAAAARPIIPHWRHADGSCSHCKTGSCWPRPSSSIAWLDGPWAHTACCHSIAFAIISPVGATGNGIGMKCWG